MRGMAMARRDWEGRSNEPQSKMMEDEEKMESFEKELAPNTSVIVLSLNQGVEGNAPMFSFRMKQLGKNLTLLELMGVLEFAKTHCLADNEVSHTKEDGE